MRGTTQRDPSHTEPEVEPGIPSVREDSIATDVADTGKAFVVTMDVPGYDREDVEVRIANDVLYVETGRTRPVEEVADGRYIRKERSHREESRSIMLPEPVDAEAVTAGMNSGVLTVHVPKAEPGEGGRAIEIGGV